MWIILFLYFLFFCALISFIKNKRYVNDNTAAFVILLFILGLLLSFVFVELGFIILVFTSIFFINWTIKK